MSAANLRSKNNSVSSLRSLPSPSATRPPPPQIKDLQGRIESTAISSLAKRNYRHALPTAAGIALVGVAEREF